jgi:site-specific DNA-methyltransferase (adenine-specific)
VSGIAIKELLEDTGMKFGKVAVVGNPPYQQIDGKGGKGTSAKPIYHLFVEAVIDHLTPDYFSFIVPSRWMVGGKGLANHRERMMNDNRMKKIVHFPGEHPIFENIFITGGTSYFLWCRNYSGKCEFVTERTSSKRYLNKYDLILQDNVAETILDKVLTKHSVYISNSCYSRNPFSIDGNFNKWALTGATCYSKGKQVNNIAANDYKDNFNIKNYYKVCVSKGDGAAQVLDKHGQKAVINSVFVLFPGEICTETYLVVKVFNSDNEAKHFSNYINSKFFRFLLGLRRTTPNLSRECFSWVPDLEDYSKPWTDEELYRKFELTDDEIKHIESKIKKLI